MVRDKEKEHMSSITLKDFYFFLVKLPLLKLNTFIFIYSLRSGDGLKYHTFRRNVE